MVIPLHNLTLGKWRQLCSCFLILAVCSIEAKVWAVRSDEIILSNEYLSVKVLPGTLEMSAELRGGNKIKLSAGQVDLGEISKVVKTGNQVQWALEAKGVSIDVRLNKEDLSVRFFSEKAGTFTWPVLQETVNMKALIWPRWEGCYIPLDDSRWKNYLVELGGWDTLEGLSMPFWGLDCGDFSLTYIVTNPYNNVIDFIHTSNKLEARFSHEFTTLQSKKEYGFLIRLGDNSSPVEPAKQFRRWLIEQGKFVDMEEKIKAVPKAARLLGAPHVYLWGDAFLTWHDIHPNKWKSFCQKLVEQSRAGQPSPGRRIKQLMEPERWAEVVEISNAQWPYKYLKSQVAGELSRLLERPDFYDEGCWRNVVLPEEAAELLGKGADELTTAEICRMNGLILRAGFPEFMLAVAEWGDGVSVKMLEQFRANGFDRMRLCVDGWEGVEKRPEVAKQADQMGYLFGTYDSYHSIHDPSTRGTDSTWTTAQFDRELFEKGPIVRRDGEKRGGFKGAGYKLSPIAARPYVEERVRDNMSKVPYNYYFVDCDAYGEVYDDYSPFHRASQADDVQARMARLAWIRDTFRVVIGSEGGSSYAAGVIHVAEGMFGPVFGWGDSDLKNKGSDYYLGQYYPPDGPMVFVKQVPMKEEYRYFYYDPQFRLPLYEVVFHDSVVTTHQWANGSLKYSNMLDTVALTELLYMVPPLYHMNLDEFDKHRDIMKRHYAFFSPLHWQVGFAQMTEFNWLSSDRMLQRTVFGDKVELVVNFSQESRRYQGIDIPGRTVLARWTEKGKARILTFTPNLNESVEK
ncbi:MAG TPA: glycoside hydrolase [Sedimentisphaerales bacterium]|nr:glycoside hydrolase [Sedimentisphaerales bacterium]